MYKISNHAIGETITINRPNWRDPAVDRSFAPESGRFSKQDPSDIAKARVHQLAAQDWENTQARLGLPHGRILNELSDSQISRTDELAGICAKSARAWETQAKEIDQVEQLRNYLPLEMEVAAARLQKAHTDVTVSLQPDLEATRPRWALRVDAADPEDGYIEALYAEDAAGPKSSLVVRSGHFINDSLDGGTGTQEVNRGVVDVSAPEEGNVEADDFAAAERALSIAAVDFEDPNMSPLSPEVYSTEGWRDLQQAESSAYESYDAWKEMTGKGEETLIGKAEESRQAEYQAYLQQQATHQPTNQPGIG